MNDHVERRLESWAKSLLDLTYRNRLLNLPLTSPSAQRQRTLRFQLPSSDTLYSMLLEETSITIESPPDPELKRERQYQSTLAESQPDQTEGKVAEPPIEVTLGPRTALTVQPLTVANRLALRLMRQSRTMVSEQGINTLFATFGVLKWTDIKDSRARRAPLLLVPVELIEDTRHQTFKLRRFDESVEFNLTLAERINGDFKLPLEPPLPEEGSEYGYEQVLEHVRSQIAGRDGWEVLEEAHVGLYQFHKLRMVRDLREHGDIAASHPVIQALATDGMVVEAAFDLPDDTEFDQQIRSAETASILDADSSQMKVIESAKRGGHLIVQGPPGTGKSQTIANVIAETIAQEKTVLFVSEKAAALEVVYRRLEHAGLGPYCLPLHSHKANKTEVIKDLYARMADGAPDAGVPALSPHEFATHDALRQRLNAYPEALHRTREPLGRSIYAMFGRLGALSDTPEAPSMPIPPVADLTEPLLDTWRDAVADAARYHVTLRRGEDHPWSILRDRALSLAEKDDFFGALISLKDLLERLVDTAGDLAASLGVPTAESVADAGRLNAHVQLVPEDLSIAPACLQPSVARDAEQLAKDAQSKLTRVGQITDEVLTRFSEDIFTLPLETLLVSYQQGFLSRAFSSSHRRNRKSVQAVALQGVKISETQERDTIQRLVEIAPELRWIEEHASELTAMLGVTVGEPWSTDPGVLDRATAELEQLSRLTQVYLDHALPASLEKMLTQHATGELRSQAERITTHVESLTTEAGKVARVLPAARWNVQGQDWRDVQLEELQEWVNTHLESFHELDVWMRSQTAMAEVTRLDLDQSLVHLWDMDVEADKWADVLAKRVLTRWVAEQVSLDSVLGSFGRERHEQDIERFRDLDTRVIKSGSRRVRARIAASRSGDGYGDAGEPQVLHREFVKKRRKLPPRLLFQRIPNLLQELKPCLMMSPLSVAHFLPADTFKFDLVIFDEASQVRPHDAIGAIMRGRQLMVAGDSKQLPPTSFFDRDVDSDDDEEDGLSDVDSVLEALGPKMPPSQALDLLWHYRSRHEDLIAFSNHFVYADKLRTFPTPLHGRTPDSGVHFCYVENGRLIRERDVQTNREQKRNREEVQEVVKLVSEHFQAFPDRSLGVVALNKWHAEAVQNAIHDAQLLDRSLGEWIERDGEEPFFVKSLEEVQGDERDVMIVSIGFAKEGYGVDANLNHNFGPINQEVGQRRINVLITRAKHKLILVSSIRDEDIDESRIRSKAASGLWLLKQYLAYAEKGPDFLEQRVGIVEGEADSGFEEEVANAIRKLGYDARLQVGVSKYRIDIGVVDPTDSTRFLMGIECDGATYHHSKVARDRDRLRQEVLEGHGWNIHRIWSTEWFRNQTVEVRRLAEALELASTTSQERVKSEPTTPPYTLSLVGQDGTVGAQPTFDTGSSPEQAQIVVQQKPAPLRVLPSLDAVPYRVGRLDKGRNVSELYQAPRSVIESMILQCIEVEAPIHIDLLVKRIANAWGYGRAGARIRERIERDLNGLVLEGDKIRRSGDFLFKRQQVVSETRGADRDGSVRRIDWVPSEELEIAFGTILRRSLSLSKSEMITETARFLGYDRTGAAIKSRLERELAIAESKGTVELVNGRYQIPSSRSDQMGQRHRS